MNRDQFDYNPRGYALCLISNGLVSEASMIDVLLQYMSHDDVRGALDANELSPRFDDEEDDEEDEEDEEDDED